MNVISDIAGQYDTLRALLKKMPQGKVLSVGDMVDRGPKSREVVEWFMEHDHCFALYGNHEDLMVDRVFGGGDYGHNVWEANGGNATKRSFESNEALIKAAKWMKTLPLSWEDDEFIVSHSANLGDPWSRDWPVLMDRFHIFGHNSMMGLRFFKENHGGVFALCIDTSASKQLCGVHLETMQIYVQEYI